MSDDQTTEFSFILKPSVHGVGVFATHEIKKGTKLRLFGDNNNKESEVIRKKSDVPEILQGYCIDKDDQMVETPRDFGHMQIGNYLNHSNNPNTRWQGENYVSIKDIMQGEEILANYNDLNEPESEKVEIL